MNALRSSYDRDDRNINLNFRQKMRSYLTISNIGIIFSCFSLISSIVTIIYFSTALYRLTAYSYVYDYKEEICVPIIGYTYQFNCGNNQKWISSFNDSSNRILVENPFSVRNNIQQALNDIGRIEINFNYTCYCRDKNKIFKIIGIQVFGCSIWTDCIIDSDFVDYIQRDNSIYYFTFISFLLSSLVTVIFSIVSILITIHEIKAKKSISYTELK
jgi:hypothetical protein